MDLWALVRRTPAPAFDPVLEQQRVTEAVLRSAAQLLHDERGAGEVIAAHCERLTTLVPHLVLAWVWFGPADTEQISPQVLAGAAAPYARDLVIQRNALTRRGPAFRTLAGQRLEPFRVSPRSVFGPWRRAARELGVRSVLALPLSGGPGLQPGTAQRGLFVLYADVPDYFETVGVGVFDALAHLFSAVLERSERSAALARAANCDALTGLANRQGLALMETHLRRVTPHDPPCAVLVADIDHFKRINDSRGHAAGDQVLRAVATVLRDTVRAGDAVARWGGEEFVICLRNVPPATAWTLANKLRERLADTPVSAGTGPLLCVTLSVGLTELQPGEDLAVAVDRADAALYAAKRAGRNCVVQVEQTPPHEPALHG
ncbi:hypothetical protein IP87_16180 [beta proteobacterium AAP121]|nr:hypothetical protein IP80_01095 [beta proteobacterium AAP65]KPF95732.1 hypothetical protein IP87_16180 [beta proteobacterium AAP121]